LATEGLVTTLLNELAAAPGEVWLVLDDYHLVDSHEITGGMAFFLDPLPPHLHVVVGTRADPDLPLSRWRNPRLGGRRRVGGAHRGMDRRAATRRPVDPGP
jgi:ATP/maltotriose-dependent transcriptional regulator MalT